MAFQTPRKNNKLFQFLSISCSTASLLACTSLVESPESVSKPAVTVDTLEIVVPIRFRYILYYDSLMEKPLPLYDGSYPKNGTLFNSQTNPFQYSKEDIPSSLWVLRTDSERLIGEDCFVSMDSLFCPEDTGLVPWDDICFNSLNSR
jgi:hypothetical protein